jgi:hypothetical protein
MPQVAQSRFERNAFGPHAEWQNGKAAPHRREERTYTDNISPRGARVYSIRQWQLGDAVQVSPRNEDPACGKVVYCQALPDDRYVIGVKFQDGPIPWSAVHRYDGLQNSPAAKSKSS